MQHDYSFKYKELLFKPMTADESEQYRLIRNLSQNRTFFKTQKEISSFDQKKWYENYLNKDNDIMFSVYKDDDFIGGVAVYDIDNSEKSAEFGRILINKKNKGFGKIATEAMICFSEKELKLKSLKLDVYCDNLSAYNMYLKCGFNVCGKTKDTNHREMYLMSREL